MTMGPDPHVPRGLTLHRVHVFGEEPPREPPELAHGERLAPAIDAATPRRGPVWWSLARHVAAHAALGLAFLLLALTLGILGTLAVRAIADLARWIAG